MVTARWNFSVGWISALLLAIFCALAHAVSTGATSAIDRAILVFFRRFATDFASSPLLKEILRDITSFGSMTILLAIVVLAAVYLALASQIRNMGILIVISIGGVILISCLKWGFSRPRPDVAVDGIRIFTTSFPSQHAALSMIVYLAIARLIAATNRSMRLPAYCFLVAAVLIFLIGISRVSLGLHYPTDILAGWSIGAVWVLCWNFDASVNESEPGA